MTQPCEDCAADGECYPCPQKFGHPLCKIFGDIPAGSSDFTQASVTQYESKAFELTPPCESSIKVADQKTGGG